MLSYYYFEVDYYYYTLNNIIDILFCYFLINFNKKKALNLKYLNFAFFIVVAYYHWFSRLNNSD